MIINEGLKEGDLQDLVLPMVSIDEYESKLDDDSIVVAFYVQDRDPANDLNRFIQKGSADVLDTDVSPSANEDGYYLVFVELLRDASFVDKMLDIIDEVRNLTLVTKWQAKVFEVEGMLDMTDENLAANVRLTSREDDQEAEIKEFFQHSILDDVLVESGHLVFRRNYHSARNLLVDFGTIDELSERNAVMTGPLSLDESAQNLRRKFHGLLGEHWYVEQLGRYFLLSRDGSDLGALLRL